MNEKDLKVLSAKKAMEENNVAITRAQEAAQTSEAYVINYQKQIEHLKKNHQLRLNDLQKQLNRVINNAKIHHDTIDNLIQKREELYQVFHETLHLGQVQCKYCSLYFKNEESLARHEKACTARPEIKIAATHEADISQKKEELLARKAALEKELNEIKEPEKKEEIPVEVLVEEKKQIAQELRKVANEMNGEARQVELVTTNCQDWIDQYAIEEGGKAIWQGRITNGFRTWCEAKGFELPE